MKYCPNCSKRFRKRQDVVAHLSQPAGPCYQNNEIVTFLQSLTFRDVVLQSRQPRERSTSPASQSDDRIEDACMDVDPTDLDSPCPSPLPEDTAGQNDEVSNIEFYLDCAPTHGSAETLMNAFDKDTFSEERRENIYYPFRNRAEWQLASFLLRSGLSMADINQLLKLELIEKLDLSFKTAKDLRSRAELLPRTPPWKVEVQKILPSQPLKKKIELYYRNPIDLIRTILSNPLVANHIHFTPFRAYTCAAKLMRIYSEWLSGDAAWRFQQVLPQEGTLLGVILSSDKTKISSMTGDRNAHPLLISLANLDPDFRNKTSNHLFLLLALLPVPKFVEKNKKIRGVLESRLFHRCLDFVLSPLKEAASLGIMLGDPAGFSRYYFTPLAGYIVDTPEAALISCVAGKTSPFTLANYKQFGDDHPHPPRTAQHTLKLLQKVERVASPDDLPAYIKAAKKERLNCVARPFWRDWAMADPATFLSPEPLHHWHKMFFDHDLKWCIYALGEIEIDFRFSILQPRTGFRHFKTGISSLRQVTGREHRDLQRHIVSVVAGAVTSPFMKAIVALVDFRYLAQAPQLHEQNLQQLQRHLGDFHKNKDSIIAAGARRGSKGKNKITNWEIPKLELLQSVTPSVRESGVNSQFSADVTEHYHITEVKEPACSTNQQEYESQICRFLDRREKCRQFDLTTSIRQAEMDFLASQEAGPERGVNNTNMGAKNAKVTLRDCINPVAPIPGEDLRSKANYFELADLIQSGKRRKEPNPPRTMAFGHTALHLTRESTYKPTPIHVISSHYQIPDLRGALVDYVNRIKSQPIGPLQIGGRRTTQPDAPLPFNLIEVWHNFQIQSRTYYPPHNVQAPQTINAVPPLDSAKWPEGRYDTILVNKDQDAEWPSSGLQGHSVAEVRLIFRISDRQGSTVSYPDQFLLYVERFDFVSQPTTTGADPITSLHILRRSKQSDGLPLGDVIPLGQARALVDLVPRFGNKATATLRRTNSMQKSTEFWLNHYITKDFYYATHQTGVP